MKELITKFAIAGIDDPSCIGADCQSASTDFNDAFTLVVNWIMGAIGFICVIVIIVGGIQYMTSTGDPGKVKKAKDTILYGIIGLVIVALAAAIVNFVIAGLLTSNS